MLYEACPDYIDNLTSNFVDGNWTREPLVSLVRTRVTMAAQKQAAQK